jgi:kynureninase
VDLSAFRADFPILERRAYLYSGGLAPGSRRVGGALTDWIGRWTSDPIDFRARYTDDIDAVRESLATLLGGAPSGYAVVDSTSRASNLAVALLDAPEGANVIADDTTYSSSLLPWYLRGVEVRIARGRSVSDRIGEIHALIDGHTIAITISHVAHTSGYRHDLVTLADLAHNAGVRLIVGPRRVRC